MKTIRFEKPENFWKEDELIDETQEKTETDIGKLKIVVENKKGEPIEDATIDVRKEGKKVGIGQTTKKGVIEKKLKYGDYRIWVKKEGYKPNGTDISISKESKKVKVKLKESKKIKIKLQVLTADEKPLQEVNVSFEKGIKEKSINKTDKHGILRNSLFPGLYQIIIEVDNLTFTSNIELNEEESGSEKKLFIKLPMNMRELLKQIRERKKINEGIKEKNSFRNKISDIKKIFNTFR